MAQGEAYWKFDREEMHGAGMKGGRERVGEKRQPEKIKEGPPVMAGDDWAERGWG